MIKYKEAKAKNNIKPFSEAMRAVGMQRGMRQLVPVEDAPVRKLLHVFAHVVR